MKMTTTLSEELAFVKDRILQAGKILLQHYERPTGIGKKEDGTFVSDADKAVSHYLSSQLQGAFPTYAILDEEQEDNQSRFEREFCWVLDPLDATKSYLRKGENWGILIGLMHNFKPVLGVTYKPPIHELAYAVERQGAYIQNQDGNRKISVDKTEKIKVLVSNSRSSSELEAMFRVLQPEEIKTQSGSLKTIEVAKGVATLFLAPASSPMSLWDLCAPSVILQEAGGIMTDLYGRAFDYSQKGTINKKGVIASNGIIHQNIVAGLDQLVSEKKDSLGPI